MSEDDSLSLHDATAVLRCKDVWSDVRSALSRAATGDRPTLNECRLVMAAVTTRVAFRSWQQPGAVTGATVGEFNDAVKETGKLEEACYVMLVARHKTAPAGPCFSNTDQRGSLPCSRVREAHTPTL